jgi:hypothetical protein
MTAAYDGREVVGMDLHRRRSVLVRMAADGRKLETTQITNSPAELRRVIARIRQPAYQAASWRVTNTLWPRTPSSRPRCGPPGELWLPCLEVVRACGRYVPGRLRGASYCFALCTMARL